MRCSEAFRVCPTIIPAAYSFPTTLLSVRPAIASSHTASIQLQCLPMDSFNLPKTVVCSPWCLETCQASLELPSSLPTSPLIVSNLAPLSSSIPGVCVLPSSILHSPCFLWMPSKAILLVYILPLLFSSWALPEATPLVWVLSLSCLLGFLGVCLLLCRWISGLPRSLP